MSGHINKYFKRLIKPKNNAIDILDIFGVSNPHLRQAFVNIVLGCNDMNISQIDYFYINHNKYTEGMFIDVYDVLASFNITDPGLQHGVKKILNVGTRGVKDVETDLYEIISAISRRTLF